MVEGPVSGDDQQIERAPVGPTLEQRIADSPHRQDAIRKGLDRAHGVSARLDGLEQASGDLDIRSGWQMAAPSRVRGLGAWRCTRSSRAPEGASRAARGAGGGELARASARESSWHRAGDGGTGATWPDTVHTPRSPGRSARRSSPLPTRVARRQCAPVRQWAAARPFQSCGHARTRQMSRPRLARWAGADAGGHSARPAPPSPPSANCPRPSRPPPPPTSHGTPHTNPLRGVL